VELDLSTEFGARVARRLRDEVIVWLTTVRADGMPCPSPVWSLWEEGTVLIYSRPDTPKIRNIRANPRVALHFDGNGQGGDIVILQGRARVVPDAPPADRVPAYLEKYRKGIARIGLTPESFARAYSIAIRVTVETVRGH
jgi:PPOX class probable F420-dependent enzyme